MPASSGDPISAALNHSLAASSKFGPDNDSLDTKLLGSAKRVLLTEIEYEPTTSYNSNLVDLKTKYIVLRPNQANADKPNEVEKFKTSLPKDLPNDSKTLSSPSGSSKSSSSPLKSTFGSVLNKCDAVLPSPKRVLYPPDKIQLGWQSKSVPIGSGMVNLGNTCYLNSTLQALFHVPAFVNWLLNDKVHKDKCETMNGLTHTECLICAMLRTLRNSMENSSSSNAIRPHLVYNKLKLICKRLVHGHQEDAHEFLRYLIESMDRSYLRIMQATNLDSYSKETTPLSQIFGGYLRTEVRCLECRHISLTFQHFQDLLLDIRQSSTLDEALEAYFSRERLGDGEEAYKCDKCHHRVAATKQFTVEKPPNVLCIQLKRFGIMGGKNSKHIQVQQSLDLTRFWVHRQSQPSCKLNYRLVSLVSHIGPSTNCGHYTAIGLTAQQQFYLFDDSVVRPVSPHSVSGNNTYIIMYELTSPNPSLSGTPNKSMAGNCTVTKPTSSNGSSSTNGISSLAKCPPSPLINSRHSQPSTPLKSMLSSQASPICAKNLQSGHKSLVPYSAESSDSESEPTTTKHPSKASLALTPVKNGFAKESSNFVKSNCLPSPSISSKTSSASDTSKSELVVNGWHVTEVERRNAPDTAFSPPQNWDVVDASKTNGKSEEPNQPKPLCNGNGVAKKDAYLKPQQNGHNGLIDHPHEEQKKLTNGNGAIENGRVPNGKTWDGNRNNGTVDYLRKSTHQGYGASVLTWNGGRTQVDREIDNERTQQRHKRSYDQMYEAEYDQGKVKKIRNNHYQKNGDMGRQNYFQDYQNSKNNGWYNKNTDRHNFYRTYTNTHRHRTYPNKWRQ